MVEAAGKRGIKQLIIVFDDAPEQNKELKERGTSDAQRLCLRAVGEATEVRNKVRAAEFCSCRAIYPHSAPDKRACRSTSGICEPTVAKATGSESVHRLGAKKEGLPQGKSFFFWSKRRDSNPRSPVPEQIRHRFLTTFVDFLVLFSPKTVLSDALVSTVST